MFTFGFAVDECFTEDGKFWFLFFTDGGGGLWGNGVFHMGHRVGEVGN